MKLKALILTGLLVSSCLISSAQRLMENLGRGLVAINKGNGVVYLGWRLLGTDSEDIAFNLYRSTNGSKPLKLNSLPLTLTTDFEDSRADLSKHNSYFVKTVFKGKETEISGPFLLAANAPAVPYLSVPLQTPAGYTPNDAS